MSAEGQSWSSDGSATDPSHTLATRLPQQALPAFAAHTGCEYILGSENCRAESANESSARTFALLLRTVAEKRMFSERRGSTRIAYSRYL